MHDAQQIAAQLAEARGKIEAELGKRIVGQRTTIELMLISLLCNSHALLLGVPGIGKSLMASTLARTLDLAYQRIQFTPDLLPADITGTDVIEEDPATGRRTRSFMQGPLFANFILADEINRTPPKTQAALLQAMQEQKVNSGKHSFRLESPFFVLATQNPIEQEGTYPLPEAQLDRFMFLIQVGYPSAAEELQIARSTTGGAPAVLDKILSAEDIIRFQEVVRRVPVPDHVYEYVVKLVRRCRPGGEESPEWIRKWVMWGPGPRAVQYLVLGAKARAVLQGSYMVRLEDVHAVAEPVLAHRILINFHAESEGMDSLAIIRRIIAETEE
jgi:MoxR-like ATPase